jgi:hypothetical protein
MTVGGGSGSSVIERTPPRTMLSRVCFPNPGHCVGQAQIRSLETADASATSERRIALKGARKSIDMPAKDADLVAGLVRPVRPVLIPIPFQLVRILVTER